MCPALALRLAADPKKGGAGKSGPPTGPIAVPAPIVRTSLLGGPRSITAG
jgi:hypothetical protein